MTWTKTGTDKYWNVSSSQGSPPALNAGTVGDLRVILFLSLSSSVSVSSVSGGGVTTWTRVPGSLNSVNSTTIGIAGTAEIWYGKITSSGTALTVTYNGTLGTTSCRGMVRDFRTSRAGTPMYSSNGFAFMQTTGHATSSPLTWPSLTTKGSDELVVGCMGNFGSMTSPSGSSTGYTYTTDADANYHIYRLSCGAAETEAATLTFSGTDGWYAHQAIFDDGLGEPGAGAVAVAGQGAGQIALQGAGSGAVAVAGQGAGQTALQGAGAGAVAVAGQGASATAGQGAGAGAVAVAGQSAGQSVPQPAGTAQLGVTAHNAIARMGQTQTVNVTYVKAEQHTFKVPDDAAVTVLPGKSLTHYVRKDDPIWISRS